MWNKTAAEWRQVSAYSVVEHVVVLSSSNVQSTPTAPSGLVKCALARVYMTLSGRSGVYDLILNFATLIFITLLHVCITVSLKIYSVSGVEWRFKVSSVRLGWSRNRHSFPGWGDFSLLLRFQRGCGAKSTAYSNGVGRSLSGIKRPRRETDHSHLFSAQAKN
jgi:hypothetical protein